MDSLPQPKTKPRWIAYAIFCALLILPALATHRIAARGIDFDWRVIVIAAVAISLITAILYSFDKRRAEAKGWRIPELTLHLAELAGGWPGAFIAQRLFRHKTSKISYQIIFWFIVVLHQYAAFDYLNGWRITRSIIMAIGP